MARRIDILAVPADEWACAVTYFTGSGMFNRKMRLHALELGCVAPESLMRTQLHILETASQFVALLECHKLCRLIPGLLPLGFLRSRAIRGARSPQHKVRFKTRPLARVTCCLALLTVATR